MEKHIQRFIEMINASKNIVFFGGAGVSTESGIPDFRSPDGLYNQKELRTTGYEPEYLLSKTCLYHEPKAFYDFYKKKMDCRKYEPNVTHMALAQLMDFIKKQEAKMLLKFMVQQNEIIAVNVIGNMMKMRFLILRIEFPNVFVEE